ncbi:MAG TPA: hypothetical protein ENN81_10430 [Phycisphaerales bacterium]|nr:hypothetical protein [Phycisphaerales bacterium]
MPNRHAKIAVFALLALIGAALVVYGLAAHSTSVAPKDPNDPNVVAKSELELTREATVGGVQRDEAGQIRKTYDKDPPKACPT